MPSLFTTPKLINPSYLQVHVACNAYFVFLESLDSCIFISAIVLVGSNASLVVHPHISLIGILEVLRKGGREGGREGGKEGGNEGGSLWLKCG